MVGSLPPASTGATGPEEIIAYLDGVPVTLTADQIANVSGATLKYGLQWAVWFNQTPAASELLALYVVPVAYSYPANFGMSFSAPPLTLPFHTFVLNVDLDATGNGAWVTIGTITVSTTGVVTLATTGGTAKSIPAGSRLRILGPATADANVAGFAVTLKGQAPIV